MEEATVLELMSNVLASLPSWEDLDDEVEKSREPPMGAVPAISGASYDSAFVLDSRTTGDEIRVRWTGRP